MSVPSAGSIGLAFGPQNGAGDFSATVKSTAAGYTALGDADFKIMPVLNSAFGTTESVQPYGNEVDQGYHPPGLYKEYYWGAGQASLYPRLENAIAWLLFGGVGNVNTTGAAGVTDMSLNTTTFQPPDDLLDFPWMTFRKFINGPSGAEEGEELLDGRVASLQFSVGAGAPMGLQVGLMALQPSYDATFSAFDTAMTDPNEDVTTTPHALNGIGPTLTEITGLGSLGDESGVEQPIINATVSIANQFSASNPRQELIVGKATPDDAILTGQTFNFEFTLKWKDADLYRAIRRGATDSYDWDPQVTRTELDFYTGTPYKVGGLPMKLHFHAAEVAWSMSPIVLRPRGYLVAQVSGVAIRQANPSDYFNVQLENDVEYDGVTYS